MTKTLEELHKAWRKANADYDRALRDCDWSELTCRDFDTVAKAQRSMYFAWANYDAAFKAHLEAMDEAAKLTPSESATTPAPPPPLPR